MSAVARRGAAELPLLVVVVLLLSTGVAILPGDSIVGFGEVELTLGRLLIVAGLVALIANEGPRLELFRARVGLPIALLLVAALVSSAKWDAWPRFRFLVEGVALFYLAFAVMRSRPEARQTVVWTALLAMAVAALVGVAQVSQGELTGFYRDGCTPVTKPIGGAPPDSITRAVGTFENPNVLGGYLLLLAPLGALAAAAAGNRGRNRVLLALLVGFAYLAVTFTYSRAAVLAAVLALAVGVAVSGGIYRRYLLGLAGVAAVIVTFLFASCGSDATAGYGREREWRDTIDVAVDEPVWGVGPGRLGDVLNDRNPKSTAPHAHNLWLTWWAEAGPGALIAWLWLPGLILWRTARAARAGPGAARGALVALSGFLAFSVLDHPANVDRVALAFWIVAALAAATAATAAVEPQQAERAA